MGIVKNSFAAVAAVGLAAGMIAAAPAASADNYAPQLPSNVVNSKQRLPLVITGGQPGCRVTYTIENSDGKKVRGPRRYGFNDQGITTGRIKAPKNRGIYRLVTRVDNWPGNVGCTPTKTVQRLRVR